MPNLYTLKVTTYTATTVVEPKPSIFRDLLEGDLEQMKTAARVQAQPGSTIVLEVTEQR